MSKFVSYDADLLAKYNCQLDFQTRRFIDTEIRKKTVIVKGHCMDHMPLFHQMYSSNIRNGLDENVNEVFQILANQLKDSGNKFNYRLEINSVKLSVILLPAISAIFFNVFSIKLNDIVNNRFNLDNIYNIPLSFFNKPKDDLTLTSTTFALVWSYNNTILYPELRNPVPSFLMTFPTYKSDPVLILQKDWKRALNNEGTDITIKFKDEPDLNVHKSLISRSDHYKRVLTSEFIESKSGQIEFPEKRAIGLAVFEFLYTGELPNLDVDGLADVYRFGHSILEKDLMETAKCLMFKQLQSSTQIEADLEKVLGLGMLLDDNSILHGCLVAINERNIDLKLISDRECIKRLKKVDNELNYGLMQIHLKQRLVSLSAEQSASATTTTTTSTS